MYMQKIILQKFSVPFEYPVLFTRDVFALENTGLKDLLNEGVNRHPNPSLLIYIDRGVSLSRPGLSENIIRYFDRHLHRLHLVLSPMVVPGGEEIKSDRSHVARMMQMMSDARLDRHSYVMAIGGGALLDVVGYSASLVHRGVRMIRLPTTVLAQNDAGVGVKTAINDPAGKNYYGTFAPPHAVVNDLDFLNSLPDEDWRGGIAEAFKVAMIKDGEFFRWLCQAAASLGARDSRAMEHLVIRCAELHLDHIRSAGDPFEMGEARPLDYGHWSAHQLELVSQYRIKHGQAVAIGIMLDAVYAELSGWINRDTTDRLLQGMQRSGIQPWHPLLEASDSAGRPVVLAGIDRFREHLGGRLSITMPLEAGRSHEVSSVDETRIIQAIQELKTRCSRSCDISS